MTAGYQVSDTNPISVFPGGKQGEVTIYNSGANTVWVSSDNSPINGVPVTAGNSIAWNARTPLYAYILDRALSTSVLIIDSGVTLPSTNVTANIPGTVAVSGSIDTTGSTVGISGTVPVNGTVGVSGTVAVDASAHPLTIANIVSPVLIQGGAGLMYSGIITVPAAVGGTAGTYYLSLPLNVNGLVYSSIYVSITVNSVNTALDMTYDMRYSEDQNFNAQGELIDKQDINRFNAFTVPWLLDSATPPVLSFYNPSPVAGSIYVYVYGTTTQVTRPTSDMSRPFGSGGISWPTATPYLYLPGSFDPYYIICYLTATVTVAFNLQVGSQLFQVPVGAGIFSPPVVFFVPGGNTNAVPITSSISTPPISTVLSALPPFTNTFLSAHPIGAIYMSVDPANPGALYGGAWAAWGAGRVPVAVDTGQTEFNTVEKTGGEKTHVLTVAEGPAHTHVLDSTGQNAFINSSGASGAALGSNWGFKYPNNQTSTEVSGSSSPHNNLQPYITCYFWKRTA